MLNIKELVAKAQVGDCEAQYELACCYLRGNGGKKDSVKALNLLTVLAKRTTF
jgi:TPR repeat protein